MFWQNISAYSLDSKHSPLTFAPGDLLIEIAAALESRSDLLNFCLTVRLFNPERYVSFLNSIQCKYIYSTISTVLYETVILNNAEQCTLTLAMLQRRPDIARHVRVLVVRPQAKRPSRDGVLVSQEASGAVRDVAATMRLDALTKFIWDGDEKPYHEDMWFALRMGCVLQTDSQSKHK